MKKVFILPLILLAACSGNKNLPDAYGNFETDEITISAENGGKITSFPSEEGSAIKLGEVLVMTDIVNLELQIDQMNAQTQAIEATKSTINAQIALADQQICNLQKDQLRIHKMAEDGAATAKQRDDIDGQIAVVQKQKGTSASQLNSIRKQVEALKAQQNVLQDKIKNSTIKSPINGTIIEKYAQIGELATPGKAVCKIADLSSLILRIYISENQLSEVKIGQKIVVSIDDKDKQKQIDGKIEWISSQAEFTPKIIQTREERVKLVYAVKIRVVNDGSLKIGMPGEVKFLEK
jgi:HlyD family secretion protein